MGIDEIDKKEIFEKIKYNIEIITEQEIHRGDIDLNDNFGKGKLSLSSYDYIMLAINLERDFNIKLPDEELDFHNIKKVSDLVDLIHNLLYR